MQDVNDPSLPVLPSCRTSVYLNLCHTPSDPQLTRSFL